MTWLGDFAPTAVSVQHKFMTANASGKPTTLGDSPSMVLYVNATTTGIASGVSVTPDFDGRTGLNHVRFLVTTSVTGVTSGTECQLVIATGSVSGISLNGYPVCYFSLMNRPVQTLATIAPARITAQGIDVGAIVTAINTNVGAVVTAVSTIVPARITAQGINVGAIVTTFNTIAPANVTSISTIAPARVTAQGIDIGAIVTAVNTIVPARITAQGIDVGAIVTAFNTIAPANVTAVSTIVPARLTAQGIDVGAIVTAINTIADANVTSFSASGLAQLFLVDSGTTFASAVAGSPVKEIADNAGGTSLSVTGIAAGVWGAEVTVHTTAGTFGKQLGGSTALPANVTSISTQVPANVTSFSTILPARITAQGIDIGAIVTAVSTIVPARITAQGINVGAIVTTFNTIAPANVTSISTIAPARVTAQGIDVGAIVTAVSTIVPARLTAQGIDVGAIVTAINTIADANVTSISASGLASLFLTDSGTTYASAVAGSPVKETADNAGGSVLNVTSIAAGVWGSQVTTFTTAGAFGKQLGGSTVLPANVTAISTLVNANVTSVSTVVNANITSASTGVIAHVSSLANGIISWPTFDASTLVNNRLDTNVGTMASVTVIGSGSASELWRGA